MTHLKTFMANKLKVVTFETRNQMGAVAAKEVAEKIKELLCAQEFVNIIFAAAPSQDEFLLHLSQEEGINWTMVNAFHMDEYIGLEANDHQTFANFLKQKIFDKVPFHEVHFINGSAKEPDAECARYAQLLQAYPADIVCMGIGENTHIAFNDPHIADFHDPLLVKIVELDTASRQQQVNDNCFAYLDEVPTHAITLTVPALLQGRSIYCIVPGKNKATAVFKTITNEVAEDYPSTILKEHNNATLYLDAESAFEL